MESQSCIEIGEKGHPERVIIKQQLAIDDPLKSYGLYPWPSSLALGHYVWHQRQRFQGSSVIELGAGTALPGLVAHAVGAARLVLTDKADEAAVLANVRANAELNHANCEVVGLSWGQFTTDLMSLLEKGPFDFILGADVLYDSADFDDLFATVTFFLQRCPKAKFITAFQHRSGHHSIQFCLYKWGLHCDVSLSPAHFMPDEDVAQLAGIIEILEISRAGRE
eukprot:jgi/Mesvir1/23823/Mv10631-RA.1